MSCKIDDIQPLFDFVLVAQFHPASKNAIIVPGTTKTENSWFEVLAVGPGKPNDDGSVRPMTVRVGDIVIFPGGTPCLGVVVNHDEKRKPYLLNEGNIVAKVGTIETIERDPNPPTAIVRELTPRARPH